MNFIFPLNLARIWGAPKCTTTLLERFYDSILRFAVFTVVLRFKVKGGNENCMNLETAGRADTISEQSQHSAMGITPGAEMKEVSRSL